MAVARAITQPTDRPVWSGLVHHSAHIIGIMSAQIASSSGFRRPIRSIEAPSSGAVTITIQPEYCP